MANEQAVNDLTSSVATADLRPQLPKTLRTGRAFAKGDIRFLATWHWYSEGDRAAQAFVEDVADWLNQASQSECRRSLLPFREDFRRLIAARPMGGMISALKRDHRRRLALWLLGYIGAKSTVPAIDYFARRGDEATRKEAVRALRRIGAHERLRRIAENDPSERIRRIALGEAWLRPEVSERRPRKAFPARLLRYLARDVRHVSTPSETSAQRANLPEVISSEFGRRPKPRELIRVILLPIHWLVRYGGSKKAGRSCAAGN